MTYSHSSYETIWTLTEISFFIALLFVERSLKEAASATQEKIPVNYRQSFTFSAFQTGHLPTYCASELDYKLTGVQATSYHTCV